MKTPGTPGTEDPLLSTQAFHEPDSTSDLTWTGNTALRCRASSEPVSAGDRPVQPQQVGRIDVAGRKEQASLRIPFRNIQSSRSQRAAVWILAEARAAIVQAPVPSAGGRPPHGLLWRQARGQLRGLQQREHRPAELHCSWGVPADALQTFSVGSPPAGAQPGSE